MIMAAYGFTLFDTPIGCCGIAWSGRGIAGFQLPEARESVTRARMVRRFPNAREAAPPREVQVAIEAVLALLRGEANDLSAIVLDMEKVPLFDRRIYEVARTIPPGATLTYGEVAARIGEPSAARAVGQALGRNPFAVIVPCHRVLAAGGKVGGFSANGGVATKRRLLAIEGALRDEPPTLFDGPLPASPWPTSAVADVGQLKSPNSDKSELGVGEGFFSWRGVAEPREKG